jgi:hypothetical protein
MGLFTYLRLADAYTPTATIAAVSEQAAYPDDNLKIEPVSKTWRTAATQVSNQNVAVDLGSAKSVSIAALVNHNLTSAATITLNGGSSANPDGSQFTTTITWARRNAWKILTAAETWRYWLFIIDDPANPDTYIEVGLALLGSKITLDRAFDFGWSKRRETVNQALSTEYGVTVAGQNIYQRTRLALSFKAITAGQRDALDDFLLGLERERRGLLFIPVPTETEAFYGRLVTDFALVRTEGGVTEVADLELLEDSPGRSLGA